MKKQTKVLVAAAMLTLGASFSAMAAEKGTWDKSTGEWMCYDKDGEAYEEEWCLYNGIEYWVNDDGILGASEWVEGDEDLFYVQSDGSKAKGVWKYIYGMDDEDAEEESWFYFDAKGKMLKDTSKKIGDNTYYFGEDGKMLTGWIAEELTGDDVTGYTAADSNTKAANAIYCNEDGARASEVWIDCFAFDTTEDDVDLYEGEDEVDYYIKSNGKPQTGINKDIDGLTYFFATNGQMLSGWVGTDDGKVFEEIEDNTKGNVSDWGTVYHTNEIGYADKNEWEKLEAPNTDDEFWYYFDKNGKVYVPEVSSASDIKEVVTFVNGDYDVADAFTATASDATAKKIDGVKYLFNDEGQMLTGLVVDADGMKYLGTKDEGAMQTGAQVIEDEDGYEFWFFFGEETKNGYTKGVAVNGNADGYCYKNGLLQTSGETGLYKEVEVAGVGTFLVDDEGKIQHKNGKDYELTTGGVYEYTFNGKDAGAKEDAITAGSKKEVK